MKKLIIFCFLIVYLAVSYYLVYQAAFSSGICAGFGYGWDFRELTNGENTDAFTVYKKCGRNSKISEKRKTKYEKISEVGGCLIASAEIRRGHQATEERKVIMGDELLPVNLKGRKHDDWPWPFKYIPRSWTAFNFGPPKLLVGKGNSFVKKTVVIQASDLNYIYYEQEWKCPKPIDPAEGWQISYFPLAPWYLKPIAWYVAKSFKRGSDGKYAQVRLGARWDDVDNYTNWPTFPTSHRYTGTNNQNTNNWEDKNG